MRTSHRLAALGVPVALLCSTLAACGGGSSGGKPGPIPSSFTVSGTASGLNAPLTLLDNGGDALTLSAPGGQFQFATALGSGAAYNVTVGKAPFAQACPVSNGSGIISANVTNVSVSCGPGTVAAAYDFGTATTDGATPVGGLTLGSDGNYYGVTETGGPANVGTVFRLSPSGTLTTLYAFKGASAGDGASPVVPPILAKDGNLYGVTYQGGSTSNYGALYKITPQGVESVVHVFSNGNDGSSPESPLLQASDGKLYGTSFGGSSSGWGAIFSYDPATKVFSSLSSFSGMTVVGPQGKLVQASNGIIYGTAMNGGTPNSYGGVFSFNPANSVIATVATFGGLSNASQPTPGLLLASDGNLYGVMRTGGAKAAGSVYELTLGSSTTLKILYTFQGGTTDGSLPVSPPLQGPDGRFYVATNSGGANNQGALVSIDPTASPVSDQLLFSFGGKSTGAMTNLTTQDLLVGSNSELYGFAGNGGANNKGAIWALN